MDSVLAFQSEGREFESRQRQVKLYFKKIFKADLYTERNFNPVWEGVLHARRAQMLWRFPQIFKRHFLCDG